MIYLRMEKRQPLRLLILIAFVIVVFVAAEGEARNVRRVRRQDSGERRAKKLLVDGFIVSSKKKVRYIRSIGQ